MRIPGSQIVSYSNLRRTAWTYCQCECNSSLSWTTSEFRTTLSKITEKMNRSQNSLLELHYKFTPNGGVYVYAKNSVSFTRLYALKDHRKITWALNFLLELQRISFVAYTACHHKITGLTLDFLNNRNINFEMIILVYLLI